MRWHEIGQDQLAPLWGGVMREHHDGHAPTRVVVTGHAWDTAHVDRAVLTRLPQSTRGAQTWWQVAFSHAASAAPSGHPRHYSLDMVAMAAKRPSARPGHWLHACPR